MLSRLASYLLRGAASGADDGEAAASSTDEAAGSIPVEARLRQVEVEGEDWILIDRNVEGAGNFAGMDESWYVTPPACFTQPGPVHVETSPLEDLLIEHPSMSVYHSVGSISALSQSPALVEKAEAPKQQQQQQRSKRRAAPAPPSAVQQQQQQQQQADGRLPLATRSSNLPTVMAKAGAKNPKPSRNSSANSNNNNRPSHHQQHHHHHHQHGNAAVAEQPRSSMRDLRNARGDENVRIATFRSAQKMLERRNSQSAKRNRLERGNKAREVSSGKGRRPRRQDRLRLNNSGANNNRKC